MDKNSALKLIHAGEKLADFLAAKFPEPPSALTTSTPGKTCLTLIKDGRASWEAYLEYCKKHRGMEEEALELYRLNRRGMAGALEAVIVREGLSDSLLLHRVTHCGAYALICQHTMQKAGDWLQEGFALYGETQLLGRPLWCLISYDNRELELRRGRWNIVMAKIVSKKAHQSWEKCLPGAWLP